MFELGEYGNAIILGDGGYGVRPFLLTPLERPQTPAEHRYNESQIRTRNPVERSYGVWKRRFPILALGMRVELEKVLVIINACAVLYNISLKVRKQKWEPEITAIDSVCRYCVSFCFFNSWVIHNLRISLLTCKPELMRTKCQLLQ
jgi:hypothetical protein